MTKKQSGDETHLRPLERQIELLNNKQTIFEYLKRNPDEVDRVVDILIKDYKKLIKDYNKNEK
jgi:hypothetical protein